MARQKRDRWGQQAERINRNRKREEGGVRKGGEDAMGQPHRQQQSKK